MSAYNIEHQTVDRFNYNEDKIDWADVIITSGGDGTFLMAASKVSNRNKPIIGINSDPTKSVGHLCLPGRYSENFSEVIERLLQGRYQWQYKQRLRVTLIGDAADEDPRELNDIRYNLRGINQFLDQEDSQEPHLSTPVVNNSNHSSHQQHLPGPLSCRLPSILPSNLSPASNSDVCPMSDNGWNLQTKMTKKDVKSHKLKQSPDFTQTQNDTQTSASFCSILNKDGQKLDDHRGKSFTTVDGKVVYKIRQLKERALNEVFVGETLSARVSYYELSVDNNRLTKMKSSGLTVCTGTGSTSWYYNINKVTDQQIVSIVDIINKISSFKIDATPEMIGQITRRFNDTLAFSATKPIMAYSVRDPVPNGDNHRGFAKRIEVKSRMQNACLVLDGCQFYSFNDGSYALIELYPEDALKTIKFD